MCFHLALTQSRRIITFHSTRVPTTAYLMNAFWIGSVVCGWTFNFPRPHKVNRLRAVAVKFCSFWKAAFWEQWVCMMVPSRGRLTLWQPVNVRKLPVRLQCFYTCLKLCPSVWGTQTDAQKELVLLGCVKFELRDMLASIAVITFECEQILQGRIAGTDNTVALDAQSFVSKLNDEQRHIHVIQRATQPSLFREVDTAMQRPAIAIFGYAGTGKSIVACAAAEECHSQGRKVAVFTWAAKQAVDMREHIPFVTADTIYSAFALDSDHADAAANLMQYALVLVNEVMQYALVLVNEVCALQKHIFDRIMDVWTLASRSPAVVLMGDWHQLEPHDRSNVPRASIAQSDYFPFLQIHNLTKQNRVRDSRLLKFQSKRCSRTHPDNLTFGRSCGNCVA